MKQSVALTSGKPWKRILAFTFPIFAGLLLQQLYNTVDTIIVGRYAGDGPLAAVGACGVLTMAFLALANGFSAGAGVLVAQLVGAGKESGMRRQAASSLLLLFGMGAVATAVGLVISQPFLEHVLATPVSLLPMANSYFQIYCIGLIFQFGYNVVAAVLRGVGDSAATLYFLLIASIVNVVLDIVFVCYMNMGVVGAAVATDIAQAGSCFAGLIYMSAKYPVFRWKLGQLRMEKEGAVQTLRIGSPMALQQLIVSFGFVFIQRAVNSYGESMTASFTVAQKVETYMILPASALMTAQGTYTAQNIGAGRMDRVISGAKQTAVMSVAIACVISAAVLLWARPIVALFGLGEPAASYCTSHVQCVAICLAVFASYFPLLGLFQGADNALYSTLVATVALAVRVASTYIMQEIPEISYNMIWWNTAFGWGVGCIITWVHFCRRKWMPKEFRVSPDPGRFAVHIGAASR